MSAPECPICLRAAGTHWTVPHVHGVRVRCEVCPAEFTVKTAGELRQHIEQPGDRKGRVYWAVANGLVIREGK